MENYLLYIGITTILIGLGFIGRYSGIENIKNWLLFAVIEAEKSLGNGTGILKLHIVYDACIQKFPFISKIITFNYFSKLVDLALDHMKEIIENNKDVKTYIENR